jgi:hypothetical protein
MPDLEPNVLFRPRLGPALNHRAGLVSARHKLGIQDEILTRLAKIADLKVISRAGEGRNDDYQYGSR